MSENIKNTIFILSGLPRSGKSTLRRIAKDINPNLCLICSDQIRQQVYGRRFFNKGESLMLAIRSHIFEILLQNKNNIIVDETNTTKEKRNQILDLAIKYNYKTILIYLNTDFGICKERIEKELKDENQIKNSLLNALKEKYNKLEVPTLNEGFDEFYEVRNNEYSTYLSSNIFRI